MGTVSELQVGDGARARLGLKETSTLSEWCGSEQTIFGLSLYHLIYVKFR